MEKLLSPAEVAAWLDVPLHTIYQWRYHGTGPRGARVGKHVRYDRIAVEEWLASQADSPQL